MSPSHASLLTSWIHIQNCLKGHFLVRCPVTPWTQIELNSSSFPNQFLLLHLSECFTPPHPGPSHKGQSGFTFLSSPLLSVTETCGFPPSHLPSPPTSPHACGGFCRQVALCSPLMVTASGVASPRACFPMNHLSSRVTTTATSENARVLM